MEGSRGESREGDCLWGELCDEHGDGGPQKSRKTKTSAILSPTQEGSEDQRTKRSGDGKER